MTIDDQKYSGKGDIDQVVGGAFTVAFSSDWSGTGSGFELTWSCNAVIQSKPT